MQRIMVDFPDPEGPHTTIRSPRFTSRSMPLRTLVSPYHFSTLRNSIMRPPFAAPVCCVLIPSMTHLFALSVCRSCRHPAAVYQQVFTRYESRFVGSEKECRIRHIFRLPQPGQGCAPPR